MRHPRHREAVSLIGSYYRLSSGSVPIDDRDNSVFCQNIVGECGRFYQNPGVVVIDKMNTCYVRYGHILRRRFSVRQSVGVERKLSLPGMYAMLEQPGCFSKRDIAHRSGIGPVEAVGVSSQVQSGLIGGSERRRDIVENGLIAVGMLGSIQCLDT